MGLAASAASAILVKAEISNLELETQQIQRQKLNLANQSAAIEEKALQMTVPTPPSTYDPQFLTTVYEGTDSDGKGIVAAMGDNGVQLSYLSKNVPTLIEASSGIAVKQFEKVDMPKLDPVSLKVQMPGEKQVTFHKSADGSIISDEEYSKLSSVTPIPDGAADPSQYKAHYPTTETVWQRDPDEKNTKTVTVSSVADLPAYANQHTYFVNGKLETNTEEPTYDILDYPWNGGSAPQDIAKSDTAKWDKYFSGISRAQFEQLQSQGYCVGTEFAAGELKESNVDEYGHITDQLFKKLPDEDVNGASAMTVDEALGKYRDNEEITRQLNELIAEIKNYLTNENNGNPIIDSSNWRIIGSPTSGFHAVRLETKDDGSMTATTFNRTEADSAYVQAESCTPNIDPTTGAGSITYTKADGTTETVAVIKSQKLDTVKYNRAQDKYNQDKAEYDRCQEQFNQETKKIQRVDKQFDMKLERLANERAALEKQLEDLDKVKEDNTEKSFSAFS